MYMPPQLYKNPSSINTHHSWIRLAFLTGMAFAVANCATAELVGTQVDVNAVNFPGNGFGQIELNNGPQQLGDSGLTVNASTTTLSDGAELLEVWWSNEENHANALANDVNSPSFAGLVVGPPTARPLIYSNLLISMTRDGEPVSPSNPFGLPPLKQYRTEFLRARFLSSQTERSPSRWFSLRRSGPPEYWIGIRCVCWADVLSQGQRSSDSGWHTTSVRRRWRFGHVRLRPYQERDRWHLPTRGSFNRLRSAIPVWMASLTRPTCSRSSKLLNTKTVST